MTYIFKEIQIPQNENFKDFLWNDGNRLQELNSLSKINIFIWPNNSGKSRFMREISKIEEFKFIPTRLTFNFKDFITSLNELIKSLLQVRDQQNAWFWNFNMWSFSLDKTTLTWNFDIFFSKKNIEDILSMKNTLNKILLCDPQKQSWWIIYMENVKFINSLKEKISSASDIIKNLNELALFKFVDYTKNYTPALRSVNNIRWPLVKWVEDMFSWRWTQSDVTSKVVDSLRGLINNDLFEEKVKKDYFTTAGKDYKVDINSWQKLNEIVKKMLLWTQDQRNKIKKYQEFLKENLFDGQDITLISKDNNILWRDVNKDKRDKENGILHIKIWDEDDRAIYDLWDWIQTLITITLPLFECTNGLFFIEEPELYLHPWMQRKLIEVLIKTSDFIGHQFFITTHSNNFLDLTLDFDNISIFKARKTENKQFIIENIKSGDENILLELWVQKSSIFIANSTIWVEGITDRLYLGRYLDLYQKQKKKENPNFIEVKQDIDYCFVEYWGNNITHFSFLDDENWHEQVNIDRLCGKSFLIIDEDWENRKKERKEKLKEKLEKRYNKLPVREIENLLSLNVLKDAVTELEKKCWNQSVEFKTRIGDHRKTKLGEFIEKKLLVKKMKTRYKAKWWTIRDKVKFYETAIKYINNYEDLSAEAKEVAENIYQFILSQKDK